MIRALCFSISLIVGVVTLAAEGAVYPVDGTVVDRAGEAIQNASIAVDGRLVLTTGADGRFLLELRPGSREITITHPTRQTLRRRLTVDGPVSELRFELSRHRRLPSRSPRPR
jgi:hypothetical protein